LVVKDQLESQCDDRNFADLEAAVDSFLISRNPEIMSGALCFSGTRVPVQNLFDYLKGNSSLEDFPSVFALSTVFL